MEFRYLIASFSARGELHLKKSLQNFMTAKCFPFFKGLKNSFCMPKFSVSGRGGEAYFVIVTNVASGGGDVAYIVTNLALPLASLS